jgi:hypothetical protein
MATRDEVQLWRVSEPLDASAARVALWAVVATGAELDADGVVRLLDARAWQERKKRLEELGGPPAGIGQPSHDPVGGMP